MACLLSGDHLLHFVTPASTELLEHIYCRGFWVVSMLK